MTNRNPSLQGNTALTFTYWLMLSIHGLNTKVQISLRVISFGRPSSSHHWPTNWPALPAGRSINSKNYKTSRNQSLAKFRLRNKLQNTHIMEIPTPVKSKGVSLAGSCLPRNHHLCYINTRPTDTADTCNVSRSSPIILSDHLTSPELS